MGITGDPDRVQMALKGLDTISDTFFAGGLIPFNMRFHTAEKSTGFQRFYQTEIALRAMRPHAPCNRFQDFTALYRGRLFIPPYAFLKASTKKKWRSIF